MRHRRKAALVAALLVFSLFPLAGGLPPAGAIPNPVATDEITYQAFGRVFPDPHGCLNEVGSVLPKGVSPWAKGNVCTVQFLQYQEVIEGTKFLATHLRSAGFPFIQIYDLSDPENGNHWSAGLPRTIATEEGRVQIFGRDKRPLYLFKLTNPNSPVAEEDKLHFAYGLSIHGIERAGLEGGIRAMEDLATWAACEQDASVAPACAAEGVGPGSPKPIIETPVPEGTSVPTAGQVLDNAVVYFMLNNPDGWARGEVSPVEFEEGQVNASHLPGAFFQRYNGNGVDLNRDWPAIGYTFKPYSPWSEPESRGYGQVLKGIRDDVLDGEAFAGGIDLHGMITADAFSYTLLGAGQRDFRKNALTVDTALRAWQDQTQRLAWSPWIADSNADGQPDGPCIQEPVFGGNIPACVADEWGTVIDTIGYQVTGSLGDWIDSPMGLNGVGINNEMYTSHIVPNTVYEPALEQTHIDGNKGLIYSQISSLLTARDVTFDPGAKVGYVFDPSRLQVAGQQRVQNPGLPAQNDFEVMLPCQSVVQPQLEPVGCKHEGTFAPVGTGGAFEFEVRGPADGVWNGGLTTTYRGTNVNGVGVANTSALQLQHFEEGQWHTVAYHFRQGGGGTNPNSIGIDLYLPTGQVATVNDPMPGRWRVYFPYPTAFPGRLRVEFSRFEAERDPGQVAIDASSMDFFDELNRYVPAGQDLEPIQVAQVISDPASLAEYDTVVLVDDIGSPSYLRTDLGLGKTEWRDFFVNLRRWTAGGGNLVLTDAALQALPQLNKNIAANQVRSDRWRAGSYHFDIGETITYREPEKYPLAEDVNKPGAAEEEPGRRQAAEPTPLGYTPDEDYDTDPMMPFWGVDRQTWEAACGLANCVTALSDPIDDQPANQQGPQGVGLGEMRLGQGRVRVVGVMFPDPVFEPDEINDHRFGVADYALTYTAYEVFENVIDPTPLDPD